MDARIQDTSLPIQLPVNALRNEVEDDPGIWVSYTLVGDLDKACGCWLQPGPSLAIVAMQGMSQWMEDFSFHLSFLSPSTSLPLCVCVCVTQLSFPN